MSSSPPPPSQPSGESHFNDASFRAQLHALMIGGFCSMASARVCDSMLPQLAKDFGGTISSASKVVSAFALAYGLTQLMFGPLGDRFGKVRVIFCACMAAGLGAAFCALSGNLQVLSAMRFFAGGMAAGVIPLSIAWIGDTVPYDNRQAIMAKLMGGTLSGLIMGQILGGLASDTLGWRSAFWILAVMFTFSALRLRKHALARQPGAAASTAAAWWQGPVQSYATVLKMPHTWMILPVVCVEGFLVYSSLAFIPSMVHDREAVSLSVASLSVAGFGLGGIFYAWRSQAWLKKLGEKGFTAIGGCLFGLGMLFVVLVPGLIWAMIGCFAAGLGFYMLHNTLQTLGSQISPQARGSAMALFALVLFLGQTLGVMSAAWIVSHYGYTPTLMLSALGIIALGLFVASQLRRMRLI